MASDEITGWTQLFYVLLGVALWKLIRWSTGW